MVWGLTRHSRQVVIDYQGDLLHIDTTRPDVGCNKHTTVMSAWDIRLSNDVPLATAELCHDRIPLLLHHLSMHARHRKVCFTHFFGEPVDLAASVALDRSARGAQGATEAHEDDCLCDGQAGRISPAPYTKLTLTDVSYRSVRVSNLYSSFSTATTE